MPINHASVTFPSLSCSLYLPLLHSLLPFLCLSFWWRCASPCPRGYKGRPLFFPSRPSVAESPPIFLPARPSFFIPSPLHVYSAALSTRALGPIMAKESATTSPPWRILMNRPGLSFVLSFYIDLDFEPIFQFVFLLH